MNEWLKLSDAAALMERSVEWLSELCRDEHLVCRKVEGVNARGRRYLGWEINAESLQRAMKRANPHGYRWPKGKQTIQDVDEGPGPHACDWCARTTETEKGLRRHMELKHPRLIWR